MPPRKPKGGGKPQGRGKPKPETVLVQRKQATYYRLMKSAAARFEKMVKEYRKLEGSPRAKKLLEAELKFCNGRLKKATGLVEGMEKEKRLRVTRDKGTGRKIPLDWKTAVQNYERVLIEEKKWLEAELERFKKAEKEKKKPAMPGRVLAHEQIKDSWNSKQTFEENVKRISKEVLLSEREVSVLAHQMELESKKEK